MHSQVNNYFNMYDMNGSVIGLTGPFFVAKKQEREQKETRLTYASCYDIFLQGGMVMKLPVRKANRLKNFDYSSNGMYFITICTKNKEHILCSIVGDGVPDVPQNIDGVPDVQQNVDDISVMLSHIGEIVEKHISRIGDIDYISVDKYVIMPNHIHLIIAVNKPMLATNTGNKTGTSRTPSPTNANIPRTIAGFKRLINKEVGRNIFQRSYHDHVIRDEKDYEKIWEYIETNPFKWEKDCFYSD